MKKIKAQKEHMGYWLLVKRNNRFSKIGNLCYSRHEALGQLKEAIDYRIMGVRVDSTPPDSRNGKKDVNSN